MLIEIILLSCLSGLLYRLGGWGDEGRKKFPKLPKWVFDTKARDVGCGLCTVGMYSLMFPITTWMGLICAIVTVALMLGALSTYWDELFGFDNFWFHGFCVGIALLPLVALNEQWLAGLIYRPIALAITMGLVSTLSGSDVVEEGGRGFAIVATLPLLLIGG